MAAMLELESARLILRQWHDDDLSAFASLCEDPQVMRFFPDTLSRLQSAALIGRVRGHFAEHGFGLWALQRKDSGSFIGFTGLNEVGFDAPFTPAVEISWRLAREHWGLGFASEAAWAALGAGFERFQLAEVVAMAAVENIASEQVMKAIGMRRNTADDFDHPCLQGHSLQRHMLYRINREQWLETLHG